MQRSSRGGEGRSGIASRRRAPSAFRDEEKGARRPSRRREVSIGDPPPLEARRHRPSCRRGGRGRPPAPAESGGLGGRPRELLFLAKSARRTPLSVRRRDRLRSEGSQRRRSARVGAPRGRSHSSRTALVAVLIERDCHGSPEVRDPALTAPPTRPRGPLPRSARAGTAGRRGSSTPPRSRTRGSLEPRRASAAAFAMRRRPVANFAPRRRAPSALRDEEKGARRPSRR